MNISPHSKPAAASVESKLKSKMMAKIQKLLKRNKTRRQETARQAVYLLTSARVLLHASPASFSSATTTPLSANFALLPREVQEMIINRVGSDDLLKEKEKKAIILYASGYKENLGRTRSQFLESCLQTITCWTMWEQQGEKRE